MIGSGAGIAFGSEFFNRETPVHIPLDGFRNSRRVRLVVVPNHNGDRFAVDLRTGDDIALHFNPRFNEGAIITNHTVSEHWQHEGKSDSLPFEHGKAYTLEFVSADTEIHVYLNGNSLLSYSTPYALEDVRSLDVSGNVHVHSVHVIY
ncbi:unnamed protein product [Auanema sp. JU1783]|nr:unnamed protein product [Auanema sp. JU1783]